MTLGQTKQYIRDKFKVTNLKDITYHKYIPAPQMLISSEVKTTYYPKERHTREDFEIAKAKEARNLCRNAYLSDKRNWYEHKQIGFLLLNS